MKALLIALLVAAPAPVPGVRTLDVAVEVVASQLVDGAPVKDPRARFRQVRRSQARLDQSGAAVRATMLLLQDEDTFDGATKVHPSIAATKQYELVVDGDAVKIRRVQKGGFGYVDDGTGLGKTPTGSEDDDLRGALLGLPARTAFARAVLAPPPSPGTAPARVSAPPTSIAAPQSQPSRPPPSTKPPAVAPPSAAALHLDAALARRAFPVEKEGMFRVEGAALRHVGTVDEGGRRLHRLAVTVDVVVTDPEWSGTPFTLRGDAFVDAADGELFRYEVVGRFTVLDGDEQTLGGTLSAKATLTR